MKRINPLTAAFQPSTNAQRAIVTTPPLPASASASTSAPASSITTTTTPLPPAPVPSPAETDRSAPLSAPPSSLSADDAAVAASLSGAEPAASAESASPESAPRFADAYAPRSVYSFRLRLPGRVASRYVRPSRDVEEVMEERLERCADHDAETPLTFTDEQRRALLDLLGTADPESVVRHVRNLVTAVVEIPSEDAGGVPVTARLQFSAEQLERCGFRCVAGERLIDKLQEFCNYGINANVGL